MENERKVGETLVMMTSHEYALLTRNSSGAADPF